MASASLFPAQPYLVVGETKPLATEVYNPCGNVVSGAAFKWTSSNPGIVAVNDAGHLTGLAVGSVDVVGQLVGGPGGRALFGGEGDVAVTARVRVVSVSTGTVKELRIYPKDPKTVPGVPVQLTAVPVDESGAMVPGRGVTWSTNSGLVAILGDGLVSPAATATGVVNVQANLTDGGGGNASTAPVITKLTIQAVNGSAPPLPEVTIVPSSLNMYLGPPENPDIRTIEAQVTDPNTGAPVSATVTWQVTPAGVVSLVPLVPSGQFAELTAVGGGAAQITATATTATDVVVSAPATVDVLAYDAYIPGTWTSLAALPLSLSHHRMNVIDNRLFVTGGVSSTTLYGGIREDVLRATIGQDGLLTGPWEQSFIPPVTDPILRLFTDCPMDAPWDLPCMYFWRDIAHGAVFAQTVHYQVMDHTQAVATDALGGQHLYVVTGVDAQVDLGVQPDDPNAVGPDLTRFSDVVLMADVQADGGIPQWKENQSWNLPSEGTLAGGLLDVPGRAGAAIAVHGSRLYLTGGWGWAQDPTTLGYTGRNRSAVWVTELDALTGAPLGWTRTLMMPEPRNRHAAAVVGSWLVVSGGVTGIDQNVADQVLDTTYLAFLEADGSITRWNPGRTLPRPLSRHKMLSIPGTNYLLVIGGDDLYTASPEIYLTDVNQLTGAMGPWRLLPVIPPRPNIDTTSLGLTGFGAAATTAVDANNNQVVRLYLSGGGPVGVSGPVNYEIERGKLVWMLEFIPQ